MVVSMPNADMAMNRLQMCNKIVMQVPIGFLELIFVFSL